MYLDIEHITKSYTSHLALDGVSFHIPENKIFGLLGPNGAGKTTLIRIITQIIKADSGKVMINGRVLSANDVYNMGYLPEERGLYKKMKVGEQCLYLAQLKGLSGKDSKRQLGEWFEKFEITHWWNKRLEELSKGMQQKVQFVVTVAHNPQLLILDEPFSGFDPINADLIKKEILELKNKGTTIILSTHDMNSVEELCEEIALINKAKVVLNNSVAFVRQENKTNIMQVRISTPLDVDTMPNDFFDIVSKIEKEDYVDLRIYNKKKILNNELINILLSKYDIISFNEEVPSMNEIFIQTVNNE